MSLNNYKVMLNHVMYITSFISGSAFKEGKFAWYFLYHHHQLSAPLVLSEEMMKLDQHQAVYYYKHKSIKKKKKLSWLHFIEAVMNKSSSDQTLLCYHIHSNRREWKTYFHKKISECDCDLSDQHYMMFDDLLMN